MPSPVVGLSFSLFDPMDTQDLKLPKKPAKPRKPRAPSSDTKTQRAPAKKKKNQELTPEEQQEILRRKAHAAEDAPWFQAVKAAQKLLNKRALKDDYEPLTPELEKQLLTEPGSYDLCVYFQPDLCLWQIGKKWDGTPYYDKFEKMRLACVSVIVNGKYFIFLRPTQSSRLFQRDANVQPPPVIAPVQDDQPNLFQFMETDENIFEEETSPSPPADESIAADNLTLDKLLTWMDGARQIHTFNHEEFFGMLKFYLPFDQRILYWCFEKTRDAYAEAYRQCGHSEIRLLEILTANGIAPGIQPCDEATMLKLWKTEKETERTRESKDPDQTHFKLTGFELEMLHWCNCVLRLNRIGLHSELRVPTHMRSKAEKGMIDMQTMMCKWHTSKQVS